MKHQIHALIRRIKRWFSRSGHTFVDSDYLSNPIDTGSVLVKDLVEADFHRRVRNGKVKYGVYLQVEDGRDPLIDLYHELWDGVMYTRKELYRRYGK